MTAPQFMAGEDPDVAFEKPWQVEAFATIVVLRRQGVLTWDEWVHLFSTHINTEQDTPGEGITDGYYRHWMDALEEVLAQRLDILDEDVTTRQELWYDAYLGTPHGHPIVLENHRSAPSCRPPQDELEHHHHDEPTLSRDQLAERAVPAFVDVPVQTGQSGGGIR